MTTTSDSTDSLGLLRLLAASVVAHDNQIEALMKAEKHEREMKDLVRVAGLAQNLDEVEAEKLTSSPRAC